MIKEHMLSILSNNLLDIKKHHDEISNVLFDFNVRFKYSRSYLEPNKGVFSFRCSDKKFNDILDEIKNRRGKRSHE